MSERFRKGTPSVAISASWSEREPSGRLLEPHREVWPRGMIVAVRCCKAVRRTESGLQAPRHLFNKLRTILGCLTRRLIFLLRVAFPDRLPLVIRIPLGKLVDVWKMPSANGAPSALAMTTIRSMRRGEPPPPPPTTTTTTTKTKKKKKKKKKKKRDDRRTQTRKT